MRTVVSKKFGYRYRISDLELLQSPPQELKSQEFGSNGPLVKLMYKRGTEVENSTKSCVFQFSQLPEDCFQVTKKWHSAVRGPQLMY